MLDMLLCYGFAANMIRAGYLGLAGDLFRQVWASFAAGSAQWCQPEPDGLHSAARPTFGPLAKSRCGV
jgi:hypothetical protein